MEADTSPARAPRKNSSTSLLHRSPQNLPAPVKLLINRNNGCCLWTPRTSFSPPSPTASSPFALAKQSTSNYRTMRRAACSLDADIFWRPHRSYLVNIHHIKESCAVVKSSYMLKMNDKKQTKSRQPRQQTKRLRELFKL